jgi:hypothetical protein
MNKFFNIKHTMNTPWKRKKNIIMTDECEILKTDNRVSFFMKHTKSNILGFLKLFAQDTV